MFWRRRRRLDEEVASHLAEETADNIERGMTPAAARNAALRAFGNVEAAKERARERDPFYWFDTVCQDVRFAFRLIARNRWLSVTIVATLTVGIGLNVSVFSLLNGFFLQPWVGTEPDTFIGLHSRYSGRYRLEYSDGGITQPDYVRYRDSAKSLAALAAYRLENLTLSGAESGRIRGGLISCNMADVIRPAPPVLGRYLTSDDCATTQPVAVAVVSEATWRTRFNGDTTIVGRTILLNRVPFMVVGVAPSLALPRPESDCEVWVPYTLLGQLRPSARYFADPRAQWLTVVGRRRPEYPLRQVQEELSILARSADEDVPGRQTSLIVTDGSLIQDPDVRGRAPVIFAATWGTATVLLLLACVNVATLLLSRSAARQREIAVRLSLGAARFRLVRQLLTEGMVLSGLAAFFSVLIVQRGPAALWNSVASYPAPFDLSPDWRVLLYCMLVAMATGLVAGLSPSAESLRPQLSESLKGSSGSVTSGRRRSRLRGVLVAVQVALSLMLLVQVALFIQAQRRFFSYDPGFETEQVLNVTFASVLSGFDPPASFYREVESRVSAVPGVVTASFASMAPWSGRNPTAVREIDGRPIPEPKHFMESPARRVVSPEYFSTLDIAVTRGRVFTRDETSSARTTIPAVISESMARRYWPGQDRNRPSIPRDEDSRSDRRVPGRAKRELHAGRWTVLLLASRPAASETRIPAGSCIRRHSDGLGERRRDRSTGRPADGDHHPHARLHGPTPGRAAQADDDLRCHFGRPGAAAGADRRIRRRLVLSQSAHPRDWYPHGARRPAPRRRRTCPAIGRVTSDRRTSCRRRPRLRPVGADGVNALRRQSARSAHAGHRTAAVVCGRTGRDMDSCPTCGRPRSAIISAPRLVRTIRSGEYSS